MSAVADAIQGLSVADCLSTPPGSQCAEVLHNQACLSCILSILDDDKSLLRASAVCKQWKAVLDSDAIWQAVYCRILPQPLDYERVSSYRQQFRRLRGLLDLPAPQATPLKGAALCYNPTTGSIVSYNARQRMLSVQLPDGTVRSQVTDVQGDGSAHRPLLASTGNQLVVLAAFDGPLQLWDAGTCTPVAILGSHHSFITSLDASGDLVASTCHSELRLWNVDKRQCLFQVPIGLPMPSPVLEPHVAICHQQQLLALANCAAPAPSSVVKVYSTMPAGRNSSSSSRAVATTSPATADAQQQQQQASVHVGSSDAPNATGALLLRELPVNAAADLVLQPGLLLVASCFHGRAVSSNTPYKSERPFTVVVQIWDTQRWQLTRLISPRLWTDYPIFAMQGMPLITLTQGMLLCATLRSGATRAPPSCCIHAWQLPQHLLKADQAAVAGDGNNTQACSSTRWPYTGASSGTNGSLCVLSVSPSKQSGMAAAASSSGAGARSAESYGEGAMALGRSAVAVAGGGGSVGVSANNTVMLSVSDQERDQWMPLLNDTSGRLTVMLTTPDQLVMATESGHVLSSRLLPLSEVQSGDVQQGQRPGRVVTGSDGDSGVVHVADGLGGFIDLSMA